jgi:hypothetical protein
MEPTLRTAQTYFWHRKLNRFAHYNYLLYQISTEHAQCKFELHSKNSEEPFCRFVVLCLINQLSLYRILYRIQFVSFEEGIRVSVTEVRKRQGSHSRLRSNIGLNYFEGKHWNVHKWLN